MSVHRPDPGRVVPTATYRLQVHAGFGFDAAAEHAAYLASLGVSHLYLSPVLQPAPGSTHGYDVLDHTRISEEAGGREAFSRLVTACRQAGLGIIVDVVPNHMTVPEPTHLNAPFWSLLRDGRRSPYAGWFDVDWVAEDDRVLMPVLGGSVERALERGDLVLADDGGPTGHEWVLRHYGDEFPVAPGTETLPLHELVDAQAYRLSSWREAGEALNYRRFFDVTSLVAVRVEDPVVFMGTHALLLSLYGHGEVDGFRIDHPDGLADPEGYLARLADATSDAWVVVEKILEGEETLAESWRCAGHDRLRRAPAGAAGAHPFGGRRGPGPALGGCRAGPGLARRRRRPTPSGSSSTTCRPPRSTGSCGSRAGSSATSTTPPCGAPSRRCSSPWTATAPTWRRGRGAEPEQAAVVDEAAERARGRLAPSDHEALAVVVALVLGRDLPQAQLDTGPLAEDFRVRFQQTCGPVMAKGIEDTAYYRWFRLAGANEVGGDPDHLSIAAESSTPGASASSRRGRRR